VFFFQSVHVDSNGEEQKYILYMGLDKFENEELIRYSLPQDVWFHVDNYSSAHVYLRMPPPRDDEKKGGGGGGDEEDMTIKTIPDGLMMDICQLTKQNSIKGCKLNNLKIVYTLASNLKKERGMVEGQVGFHNEKDRCFFFVPTKQNEIINRLNKTKVAKETQFFIDLREKFDKKQRKKDKARKQREAEAEKVAKEERKVQAELQSYSSVMTDDNLSGNLAGLSIEQYEDDFM
jgi:predicted ribosome quality control (RQC) complex YloA/Tae2 family protein